MAACIYKNDVCASVARFVDLNGITAERLFLDCPEVWRMYEFYRQQIVYHVVASEEEFACIIAAMFGLVLTDDHKEFTCLGFYRNDEMEAYMQNVIDNAQGIEHYPF